MFDEQPLTLYAKRHRPKCVSLIRCLDGSGEVHVVTEGPGYKVSTYTVIQVYRRYRDGKRALLALGYQQEGIFWRQVPKKDQPSPVDAAEEISHEGF